MVRCKTCLIALQIADREGNNCPACKDHKGQSEVKSVSDAHIDACEIWAECDMPRVRRDINQEDWAELVEMFQELGNAIMIGDHKFIQKFIGENS